jgi:DNA-directed RNA polymerase specialized sigma24 family protein
MATDDEFLQATLPALDLVHNLARRFSRRRADAEDLVQDTYLRAWQAWTAGTRPRRAEPWPVRVALASRP